MAKAILGQLDINAGSIGRAERKALIHQTKSAWLQTLSSMDHEDDDPGTTWNERARKKDPERMSPRRLIKTGDRASQLVYEDDRCWD